MDGINEEERLLSQKLLNRECDNLMNEIKRLNSELSTQERRLKNVMALVSYKPTTLFVPILYFSIVVIRYLVASISLTVNTCGK